MFCSIQHVCDSWHTVTCADKHINGAVQYCSEWHEGCLNVSCWLHLFTAFKSKFTVLFSSRNRLLVLNYATVILAGRCYAGHTNKKRVSPGYWHTVHSLSDQIQKADKTASPVTFDFICNENISTEPWVPHSLHGKTQSAWVNKRSPAKAATGTRITYRPIRMNEHISQL